MMRKVRNMNKVINLSELAKIKTNFPEADFWIIRQGSEDKVGSPTRKFSPEYIGIKVTSGLLLPNYLYYAIEYLHSSGYFKSLHSGTLMKKHIKVSDVKNIRLG